MQENWPVINSYADRITRIASRVITLGQARGELRDGNSMILARCVLCAMEAHSNPLLLAGRAARPTLEQVIRFCIDAVCVAPRSSKWLTPDSDSNPHIQIKENRAYGAEACFKASHAT